MTKDEILAGLPQHRLLRRRDVRRRGRRAALLRRAREPAQPAAVRDARRAGAVALPLRPVPQPELRRTARRNDGARPDAGAERHHARSSTTTAVESKIVLHKGVSATTAASSQYPYFCDYVRRILSQTEGIGAATLQRGGLDRADHARSPRRRRGAEGDRQRRAAAATSGTSVPRRASSSQARARSSRWCRTPTGRPGRHQQAGREPLGLHPGQLQHRPERTATASGFQTGSSFKAFTLAAALKSGMKLNDTVVGAARPDPDLRLPGLLGRPGRQGRRVLRPVERRGRRGRQDHAAQGDRGSVNTAFAKLEEQVGICNVAEAAESMGVHRASTRQSTDRPSSKSSRRSPWAATDRRR